MFRVCLRSGRRAVPSRALLTLEPLDTRLTPNAAPQIVGFTATAIGGGWYVFSGQVIDEQPYGLMVELGSSSGAVEGLRAEVGEDGCFSVMVDLDGGSSLGAAWATTMDWDEAVSDPVYVDIDPN